MKRARLFLACSLLLLFCGTLAVLDADEPMRRWRTRFGGVLTGTWDRSLDEPDGSLIRIRSQSNVYRVRVDDLIPEDRWYVLNQRITSNGESGKTSENTAPPPNASLQPQPLPSGTEDLTAPIPDIDSEWGISTSRQGETETISTDSSLDAEFVPLPESPETSAADPLFGETPESDTEESLEAGADEPPPPPPTVPGTEPGERRVYKIGGISYPFRWCPAGTFTMGSPKKEQGRSDNEPQHEVTLTKGFWILRP